MTTPPAAPKIYHIVHHDKLASIINGGHLFSDAMIRTMTLGGTTIGMGDIKTARLSLPVKCHSGCMVGDFVPFYFCPRSIMLYLIWRANHPNLTYRGGQTPIVHLEADLYEVLRWANAQQRRWAITTSNAGARYTAFYSSEADLSQINWAAVDAGLWTDGAIREAKQSEFLLHSAFPWGLVRRIGVHSMAVYSVVNNIVGQATHRPKIEIMPDWYY